MHDFLPVGSFFVVAAAAHWASPTVRMRNITFPKEISLLSRFFSLLLLLLPTLSAVAARLVVSIAVACRLGNRVNNRRRRPSKQVRLHATGQKVSPADAPI